MKKDTPDNELDTGDVPIFEDRFKLIELGDAAVQAYNDLTPKMRRIVIAYIETGKPWMAYKRATGYEGKNETAGQMACRILKDKRCQVITDAWKKMTLDNLEVTPNKILSGLARLAFGDVRGFFNDQDGTMKPIHLLPRTQADMIAGFEVEELFSGEGKDRTWVGYTKKVKLTDRKASLDSLARTEGMFISEKKAKAEGVKYVEKAPVMSVEEWKKTNGR